MAKFFMVNGHLVSVNGQLVNQDDAPVGIDIYCTAETNNKDCNIGTLFDIYAEIVEE